MAWNWVGVESEQQEVQKGKEFCGGFAGMTPGGSGEVG